MSAQTATDQDPHGSGQSVAGRAARSTSSPVAALSHGGASRWRGMTAASGIVTYLVLLLAIPSNVTISALATYGRPSLLWGLVLFAWWLLSRLLYRVVDVRPVPQPLRHALGALVVVALVSFAAAMFRGQPADQVSPAISALVRLASWAGVVLVTIDGVRTIAEVKRIARSLAIAGGLLAALGLAQSILHKTLLDFYGALPGLSYSSEGVTDRGDFARAMGTATHPLEFAVSLIGLLPIAFGAAVTRGFHDDFGATPTGSTRQRLMWWVPAVLIMVTSMIAVSRSAIIGLLFAVVASMFFLPTVYRWVVGVLGAIAAVAISVLVPGMLTTVLYLFLSASSDPSTQSRTDALANVPEFLSASPVFGVGFGTFLPRYYIFDNQLVLLVVELGVLGIISFAAIVIAALWSALGGARRSGHMDTRLLGQMFAVSLMSITVLFAFFDALSFPIAAGLFFVVVGLCGCVRTIAKSDAEIDAARQRMSGLSPEPEGATSSTARPRASRRSR